MSSPAHAQEQRTGIRAWSWQARVAAIVVAALAITWLFRQGIEFDAMALREWLIELGPVGPIVYVILYAIQVIVAPVPGLPIGAAAGFVFGLGPGLVYGTLGLCVGIAVALTAGRTWGLRLLARVAGPDAVARWEQLRLINSPITWLLIFLGPSPDLILFVAGMSRIPMRQLIPIAVIGRAPAMVGATLLGVGAMEASPWLIVAATAGGILFCFGGVLLRRLRAPTNEPAPASL